MWQDIRALRAAPTGLAAADSRRRKTFAAALRQAEELAEAAAVVSYAVRPLPLFYALSQAGRAIAAVHKVGRWELQGHGLSCKRGATESLLTSTVTPDSIVGAAFHGVSEAVHSPELVGTAELGALWAANPDLRGIPIPPGAGVWPGVLACPLGSRRSLPATAGLADPVTASTTTGGQVTIGLNVPGETTEDIIAALAAYPSLAGAVPFTQESNGQRLALPGERVMRTTGPGKEMLVMLAKPCPPQMSLADYYAAQDSMLSVVEVGEVAQSNPYGIWSGYALPIVASGVSPSPLMLWWALLLGLSSLARYHPAIWTRAVDVDISTLAVPLQQVLDVAAQKVPQRVLAALRG